METNHHEEDSKSSSEEDTDRSEQNEENHDHQHTGSGRSYECMFCKRGFTTAQALGGHMNIHRKDRAAKTRPYPSPTVSTHQLADHHHHHHHHHHHNYASISPYRAIQGYRPHDYSSSSSGTHLNYQTYIPASTWGLTPPAAAAVLVHSHDFCPRNSLHPDLSKDQNHWRGIGISRGEDDHNKEKINGGCSIDIELDLELRLGHDPY